MRPVRAGRIGGSSRRLGLFFKVFLGDMSIWAVLSGVLAYEVVRRGLDSQHAIAGIVSGLIVAIAVSVGLKQIANRVVRLNRSALEISRGDLSKALPSERPSFLGADEVDELTVAISHMQENLRDLVRHIQNTSRAVADSADEMQVSTGNVTASAEEIKESMDRIAKGADEQLGLVERASGLISGIATSIKTSANTAQAAAEAATATSTAAQAGGAAA
ncbi:MAG TPA: methyl-accepting chemotaxis protein, partial [Myxococcales bacterium]